MSAGSHSPNFPTQARTRVRRVLLGLIALLYVASVPWYRDADAPLRIVFGVPDWVAVAIGCYALAACLNAAAWRLSDASEETEAREGGRASASSTHPGAPAGPEGLI